MKYLPDIYQKDIFTIDYKDLLNQNIKCLLFDLDNTLVKYDSSTPDNKTKKLIKNLKNKFLIIIVSNSPKKRVSIFGKELGVSYYSFALKPSTKTIKKIKKKYNLNNSEIAIIGDQFITDMAYGYNSKIKKIFVDSLSKKDLKITNFNRFLENKIINNYYKQDIFKKGRYYSGR